MIVAMLLVGGVGIALMPSAQASVFALGALLARGIGWGWPGLVHYLVSLLPGDGAAQATGIVQTGSYLGSAIGPIVVAGGMAGPDDATSWFALATSSVIASGVAVAIWRRACAPPGTPALT